MNKKQFAHCSSTVLACLFAISAHGVPITASSSISNVLIDGSSPATGSFNINSAAAGLGFTSSYSVSSATLTFLFTDNYYDAGSFSRTFEGSEFFSVPRTGCGSLNCGQNMFWVDTYLNMSVGEQEGATVTVGGQTASAGTTLVTSGYYYAPTLSGGNSCGPLGCGHVPDTRMHCTAYFGCTGPHPIWNRTHEVIWDYRGDFSVSLALDSASLLDLGTDGLLDFSISSWVGNFNFLSASLQAELFAGGGPTGPTNPNDPGPTNPTNPTPTVGVPEPSSAMLLALGIVMVSIRRLRRQRTLAAPFL